MLDLKISTKIMINAVKFLKIYSATIEFCMKKTYVVQNTNKKFQIFGFLTMEVHFKKCAIFTKGATEIKQPKKHRIILLETLYN